MTLEWLGRLKRFHPHQTQPFQLLLKSEHVSVVAAKHLPDEPMQDASLLGQFQFQHSLLENFQFPRGSILSLTL